MIPDASAPPSGLASGYPGDWRERLRRLPKAELHLHLEGSVAPQDLRELALRQGHAAAAGQAATLYSYRDFSGFLQAFKTVSQLLAKPEDYAWVLRRLASALKAQGVVYAELIVSVGVIHWKRMAWQPVWEALETERRRIAADQGPRLAWIFDAVRQFGDEAAAQVLEEALRCRRDGPVAAFGIGGDEAAIAASAFRALYARAAAAGLHTTIHAGESCGPESVWSALRELRPERIGHGIQSAADPELMAQLARDRIWLEVCPTSNLRTGVTASPAAHPLRRLWEAGVPITLATDDPAMFETSLLGEYERLAEWGFGWNDLLRMLDNSFAASFLPADERQNWRERLAQAAGAGA